MLELTNPRQTAHVDDWPIGGARRGTAVFDVENNGKKGMRVSRTTTGKPKRTTYMVRCCLVDGSNGRIYILGFTKCAQVVLIPGTLQGTQYFYDTHAEYEPYKAILFPADTE